MPVQKSPKTYRMHLVYVHVYYICLCVYVYYIYIYICVCVCDGGARGAMVVAVGNGHGDQGYNLDEAVCISHRANAHGKEMKPTILFPSFGK